MSERQLRIYAIADIHSPDSFRMPKLSREKFDLVLTLGDIDSDTIDYIQEMSHGVPCLGVLGNHDPVEAHMPGLDSLHGRMVAFGDLRLGGCGGAPRYKDAPNHYTERQVARFLAKMPAVDLFVSHAPPPCAALAAGMVGPGDYIHRGFDAFDAYLSAKRPRFWVHGHLNRRYSMRVGTTTVFGVSGCQPLVLDFPALPPAFVHDPPAPSLLGRLRSQVAAFLR